MDFSALSISKRSSRPASDVIDPPSLSPPIAPSVDPLPPLFSDIDLNEEVIDPEKNSSPVDSNSSVASARLFSEQASESEKSGTPVEEKQNEVAVKEESDIAWSDPEFNLSLPTTPPSPPGEAPQTVAKGAEGDLLWPEKPIVLARKASQQKSSEAEGAKPVQKREGEVLMKEQKTGKEGEMEGGKTKKGKEKEEKGARNENPPERGKAKKAKTHEEEEGEKTGKRKGQENAADKGEKPVQEKRKAGESESPAREEPRQKQRPPKIEQRTRSRDESDSDSPVRRPKRKATNRHDSGSDSPDREERRPTKRQREKELSDSDSDSTERRHHRTGKPKVRRGEESDSDEPPARHRSPKRKQKERRPPSLESDSDSPDPPPKRVRRLPETFPQKDPESDAPKPEPVKVKAPHVSAPRPTAAPAAAHPPVPVAPDTASSGLDGPAPAPTIRQTPTEVVMSSVTLQLYSEPPKPAELKSDPTKPLAMETGISTALDRALSNFRRLFTNEFIALMRPQTLKPLVDIGTFVMGLGSELEEEVARTAQSFSPVRNTVVSKVSSTLDSFLRELCSLVDGGYEVRAQKEAAFLQDLATLKTQIESLRQTHMTLTKQLLRETSAHANDVTCTQSARKARAQRLEFQHKELMLAQIDLEGRVNRQAREREATQEELFQLDRKRRELLREAENVSVGGPNVYDALARELRLLENELQEGTLGGIIGRALDAASAEAKSWAEDRALIEKLGQDARALLQKRGVSPRLGEARGGVGRGEGRLEEKAELRREVLR
jgi:hypothetical protein